MLLRGCTRGIPLHVEGGHAYDRHLRRLVDDGLMEMRRPPVLPLGWSKRFRTTSYLHTTEAGKDYLRRMGHKPPLPYTAPARTERALPNGYLKIAESRRVLVAGARCDIARLVPVKTGDVENEGLTLPQRYSFAALDFRDGGTVFRVNLGEFGTVPDATRLVRAGCLRKTGRGLVLDPYRTYAVTNNGTRDEQMELLRILCPDILIQTTDAPNYYIHARSDREEVVVRMIFEDGVQTL